MSAEETNQSQDNQDSNYDETCIPDIDASTYMEKGLNTDDIIKK